MQDLKNGSPTQPKRLKVADALEVVKGRHKTLTDGSLATLGRWLADRRDKDGYVPATIIGAALQTLDRGGPNGIKRMRSDNLAQQERLANPTKLLPLGQWQQTQRSPIEIEKPQRPRNYGVKLPTIVSDQVDIMERGYGGLRDDYKNLRAKTKRLEAEVRQYRQEVQGASPEAKKTYLFEIDQRMKQIRANYARLGELGPKIGILGIAKGQEKQATKNALDKFKANKPLGPADEKIIRYEARRDPSLAKDLNRKVLNSGINWGDDSLMQLMRASEDEPERYYIPKDFWPKLVKNAKEREKAEAAGNKQKLEQLAYERRTIIKRQLNMPESVVRSQRFSDDEFERLTSPLKFDMRKKREAQEAKERQEFKADMTKPGTRPWLLAKIAQKYAGRIDAEHLGLLDWYLEDMKVSDTREWLPLLESRVQRGDYADIRKRLAKREKERERMAKMPRMAALPRGYKPPTKEEEEAFEAALAHEKYGELDRGELFNILKEGPGVGHDKRMDYNRALAYYHDKNIDEIRDQIPWGKSWLGGHIAGLLATTTELPFEGMSSGAAALKHLRGEKGDGFLQDVGDGLQFVTMVSPKSVIKGGKWVAGTKAGQFALRPMVSGLNYLDDVSRFNMQRALHGPNAARAAAAIRQAERSGLSARAGTIPGSQALRSSAVVGEGAAARAAGPQMVENAPSNFNRGRRVRKVYAPDGTDITDVQPVQVKQAWYRDQEMKQRRKTLKASLRQHKVVIAREGATAMTGDGADHISSMGRIAPEVCDAAENLDELMKKAVRKNTEPDRHGNPDIKQVHQEYAVMEQPDGTRVPIRFTVREYVKPDASRHGQVRVFRHIQAITIGTGATAVVLVPTAPLFMPNRERRRR